MAQVDAKDLDYSPEMKAYFDEVMNLLVGRFDKSPLEAQELVGRYFTIDVAPLERVFLMHSDAECVAADLAASQTPSLETRSRNRHA